GSGLVEAGTAQLTIGSGVQAVTPSHRPPRSVADTAEPVTHYYRAATDAGHYRMAAGLNGGLALTWVRELLNASWDELYAAASRPARHDDPIFLPHLNGERTPYLDPDLRGAWTGLAARHERADLLRSALEGVAFAAAEALAALFPHGRSVTHLRLAGGGTTAPAWRQLIADVLGIELHAIAVPGASGRGAAFLGARASGHLDEPDLIRLGTPEVTAVVRPRPEALLVHDERRVRYRETVGLLRSRTAVTTAHRVPV
ncbi:MAG: FGGY-family carbohydrate kinase, partial [Nocardioidaceae bacterium]